MVSERGWPMPRAQPLCRAISMSSSSFSVTPASSSSIPSRNSSAAREGRPLSTAIWWSRLRGWVQEHEDGAASGTPVEILEEAQACLTGALVDAVRDLPDDARVWQPENARRQTLQAWVRKHRGRPVHQRLVSRGVDADKLMGQLDLDLTMIAMERDLRVLRSVWTRVTFSATLVDGLLTEINNASGEW